MAQHTNSGGNEKGTRNRATKRSPSVSKRSTTDTRKVNTSDGGDTSPQPPLKKKNEALVLKHYRLRAADVEQTVAVVAQRRADPNDIVRRQYERGVLTDSALGVPGEDGLYGLYRGERLAEMLRSDIDGLISFALNHGVVPTIVQEYRGLFEILKQPSDVSLPPVLPAVQAANTGTLAAVTEVSDEAASTLNMFFGGSNELSESNELGS